MEDQVNHMYQSINRLLIIMLIFALLPIYALAGGCQLATATTITSASETLAPTPTPTQPTTIATTTEATTIPTTTEPPGPLNPLTGQTLINVSAEGQRPVAIMINNHKSAVPQIGIAAADLMYEMIVEGGITRQMVVFADVTAIQELGSIRSARHDYIDLVGGLDAIYVHIGGSNLANDQFRQQGTPHIDLHVYPAAYWRDADWKKNRGYEHSVKTTGELLQAAIVKSGYRTNVREGQKSAFNFRDQNDFAPAAGEAAPEVVVPYSDYCKTTFSYDAAARLYSKGQFGGLQLDLATGEAIKFTNVFLIMTKQVVLENTTLKDADLVSGSGYYISGGCWQPISWQKGGTEDSFVFTDAAGNELLVNAGKSYIGIVPKNREIRFNG